MTEMGPTWARRLAGLAAVLAMLLLLVAFAEPASGHEGHSESDGGTGNSTPVQPEPSGADGRTDGGHTGTADGEEGADVPSPTPAYMVIPAVAWGAIITVGAWVLLWRRTNTG